MFLSFKKYIRVIAAVFFLSPLQLIGHENFNFVGNWDLGEGLVVLQITRALDEDALLVRYCSRRPMLDRGFCSSKEDKRFIYSPENNFYLYEDGNKNHLLHAWIRPTDNPNQIIYEFKSRWADETNRIGHKLD